MKKIFCSALLLLAVGTGCTKKDNVVTNNNTVKPSVEPFVINGLTNFTLTNDFLTYQAETLNVQYMDSAQELVTLDVSGFPAGISFDSSQFQSSGYPSFSTILTVLDTFAEGIAPGTYPITLRATTASGKARSYTINLKVLPVPSIFTGLYDSCTYSYVGTPVTFRDSIYFDGSIRNKVCSIISAVPAKRLMACLTPAVLS